MNREGWLTELGKQIEPLLVGYKIKPYRVTCGWPCVGGLSANRRIGECHGAKSSKAGVFELFISPVVDVPLEAAGVLCHEMVHVIAGTEAAHGKKFVQVCKDVGLTKGKPRSIMPGERLSASLTRLIERLGPYPHQAIVGELRPKKPGSTVGLLCPDCECKITIGKKWLDNGMPTCACGTAFQLKSEGG